MGDERDTGARQRAPRASDGLHGTPFRALLVITVVAFGGHFALLPVVGLWVVRGGTGALGAGIATGLYLLVTVLTQLAVPALLTRFGHRLVMAGGLLALGAGGPLLALSPRLAPVLVLCALRGVGFGLLTVAGSALMAELVSPAEHGRASSRFGMALGLPQVVLVPLGVGMVSWLGFTAAFWLGAMPLLGLPLVSLLGRTVSRCPAEPRGHREPKAGHTGARDRGWLRASVAPLTAMVSCAAIQGGLIAFLPLAAPPGVLLTVSLFALTLGQLVGRGTVGGFIDRRGWHGRLLGPASLVVGAGVAVEVLAVGTSTGPLAVAAALLGAVAVGVGFGAVQNDALVVLLTSLGPGRYGLASALWNIAFDAGAGIGAVGVGALAEASSYRVAFAACAVFALVNVPTMVMARGPRRRPAR